MAVDHEVADAAMQRDELRAANARFARRVVLVLDEGKRELATDVVHELSLPGHGVIGRVARLGEDWQGFAFNLYVGSHRNPARVKNSVFARCARIVAERRAGKWGGHDV